MDDLLNKFRVDKSRCKLLKSMVLMPLGGLNQAYEAEMLGCLLIDWNLKATRKVLEIGVWIKVKSEFVLIVYQLIT